MFVEATVGDPSEFHHNPMIEVTEEEERFVLRLTRCVSIAHAIATVALELSKTGKPPEIHFGWSDESPLAANFGFLLFGEGNVPWLVRELILQSRAGSGEAAAGDYRLTSSTALQSRRDAFDRLDEKAAVLSGDAASAKMCRLCAFRMRMDIGVS